MEFKELQSRVEDIIDNVLEDEYPEIYGLLNDILDLDPIYQGVDNYEFANALFESDETKVLPFSVARLMIDIYKEEQGERRGDALCNIGVLYYTGRCGEQNYDKAIKFYIEADKLGSRQATENLGYCYYYGRNGKVDYEKAYHYFVKGALDYHIASLYKIGDMYKNGYYVEKDELEAFRIYKHCLDGLNEENMQYVGADIYIRLADCYFDGIGTNKDLNLALKYYQDAEREYFLRVSKGDFLYKKQLKRAIDMQNKVRDELNKNLPSYNWTKEN